MSYKTRPYIAGTMGLIGNPFLSYEVTPEDKLLTHRRFFDLFNWASRGTLDIERASVHPLQTFLGGVINIGAVEVSTAGKQETFRNISNVKAFVAAVEGTHPDVQPATQPLFEEADLSEKAYLLPLLPRKLGEALRPKFSRKTFQVFHAEPYRMIAAGQPVVSFGKQIPALIKEGKSGAIYAPYDGRIISIGEGNHPFVKIQLTQRAEEEISLHSESGSIVGSGPKAYSSIMDIIQERLDFEDQLMRAYGHIFLRGVVVMLVDRDEKLSTCREIVEKAWKEGFREHGQITRLYFEP